MKVERVVVTNLDGYVDVHGTRVRGRSVALHTSTLQTAATYPSLISLMVSVDVKVKVQGFYVCKMTIEMIDK